MITQEHLKAKLYLRKMVLDELNELNKFLTIDKINEQFYRRLFVRDIYSIIETYLHVCKELIKIKLVEDESQNSHISWQELVILNEQKVFLSNSGEVKTKEEYQNFESSLRFSFNLFSKEFNTPSPDYGNNDFEKLIRLSKRRNAVTHPKSDRDMIITDQEIKEVVSALKWFMQAHNEIDKGFLKWIETRKR